MSDWHGRAERRFAYGKMQVLCPQLFIEHLIPQADILFAERGERRHRSAYRCGDEHLRDAVGTIELKVDIVIQGVYRFDDIPRIRVEGT